MTVKVFHLRLCKQARSTLGPVYTMLSGENAGFAGINRNWSDTKMMQKQAPEWKVSKTSVVMEMRGSFQWFWARTLKLQGTELARVAVDEKNFESRRKLEWPNETMHGFSFYSFGSIRLWPAPWLPTYQTVDGSSWCGCDTDTVDTQCCWSGRNLGGIRHTWVHTLQPYIHKFLSWKGNDSQITNF